MTNDSTALQAPALARPRPSLTLGRPWAGRPFPFHPLLLAAYPVLFLYGENIGELRLGDLVIPLLAVLMTALVALVIGAYVLRDSRRAGLVVSAVAAFLLLYGHLGEILAPLGVRPAPQQIGWAIVLMLVLVVAVRIGSGPLANITRAVNLVAAVLVAVALITIVPAEAQRFGRTTAAAASVEGSGGSGRDIYYLVFDRYGSARSLDLLAGIDERPFLDGLRDRGLQVAPYSHANYVKTTLSLAATLNLDYLDDLVAAQDPASDDHGPIFERLSNHAVGRFLRERGYTYIHVGSNYQPTESSEIADRNLHSGGPSDFLAALYDTSALPAIARRLSLSGGDPDVERRVTVTRFQLDTLDKLAGEASPSGPSFVYAHMLIPHPPYVFARDGSIVDPTAENGPSPRDGFADQLAYLQARINTLVDRLLERPEAERPIIILQADEGPYPQNYGRNTIEYDWATATTEELEIKFGIFNAMYLPGDESPDLPPAISAVNTFRLIFDAYFGADLPLLPDRSFTSAGKFRPYDLTEITDRLPPPGPEPAP